MKHTWYKWLAEREDDLREISWDISWHGKKVLRKVKASLSGLTQQAAEDFAKTEEKKETPEKIRENVAAQLEKTVRRAYYKEGGVRYYGEKLARYVKLALPQEKDLFIMWAGCYNSSIAPMQRQLEKLEAELERIRTAAPVPVPDWENELLAVMRRFGSLATRQNLHLEAGWTPESYRDAVTEYTQQLDAQLLSVWRRSQ